MVRDWYVKTFGGTPGTRRGTMPTANFPAAATFPGGEVDVLAQGGGGGRGGRGGGAPAAAPAAAAQAPTKGRAIDHIGFEVKNLEEFCKKLQAQGITFETPYRDLTAQLGLKIAFIADMGWLFPVACLTLRLPPGLVQTRPAKNKPGRKSA